MSKSEKAIEGSFELNAGDTSVEAYPNDNKPREANETFDAWLECSGKFTNFAKVLELAKKLKMNGLAAEWESKLEK